MNRVEIRPELLHWALRRGGVPWEVAINRFPRLEDWLTGAVRPTLKQAEGFARATHTPVGFLFLDEPPRETVPLPDFRTMGAEAVRQPSADLLDTVYVCQQRQEWYREYARVQGEAPLHFVGSVRPADEVVAVADRIRRALGFDVDQRRRLGTWEEALRAFIGQADDLGVLVMVSGIVANNTHRRLDPAEFRGFAIADPLAPLVFVNGADTKSAQMFTLAHELVHIWIGQSGVSDVQPVQHSRFEVERWCNAVAAELLVPLAVVREDYDRRAPVEQEMHRLARRFKVSTLVVLRRMHDAGGLSRAAFWSAYEREAARLEDLVGGGGGGNFYHTEAARVSRRFGRALVSSTLEGLTLYRDAFQLLSVSRLETFREFGRMLGVTA
jgi:Zn-dependent peptidase ImmA (M78 family)